MWSITYDRNHSFIVLATVIMIVNYDCKTFIAQATDAALSATLVFLVIANITTSNVY